MRRGLLRAFWVIKIILCAAGIWQRTEQSNKTQAIWIFSLRHRQFVISVHYITTKHWMNLLGMSGTLTIKTGFKMCAQPPSTGVRLELISNASRSDSSLIWTLGGQRFPLPIKTQCAESRTTRSPICYFCCSLRTGDDVTVPQPKAAWGTWKALREVFISHLFDRLPRIILSMNAVLLQVISETSKINK